MRTEIRFAGFGGQGIISAGKITGKAATLFDGKHAVMMQSYGPEARGGACNADLVVSDAVVGSPQLGLPVQAIIMSQEAYEKYGEQLDTDGILIVDEDLVDLSESPPPVSKVYRVPATRIAEELGRRIVANVVMLGAMTAITGIVSKDAMRDAILSSVPPRTTELNEQAYDAGYAYGREALSGDS